MASKYLSQFYYLISIFSFADFLAAISNGFIQYGLIMGNAIQITSSHVFIEAKVIRNRNQPISKNHIVSLYNNGSPSANRY